MTPSLRSSNDLLGRRILVLEDDEDIRYLISDILELQGAAVVGETRAEEAIRQLDRQRFHLLIAELDADYGRGESVIDHAARCQPHLYSCTIVMTRNPFATGRRERLARLGRVVLYKPFSIDALRGFAVGLIRNATARAA
jgi:DNA-binding response OmpR family regulator